MLASTTETGLWSNGECGGAGMGLRLPITLGRPGMWSPARPRERHVYKKIAHENEPMSNSHY